MKSQSKYYVYVYIDPRNFEEFYYGKGMGSRKDAHLLDKSDSDKTKRIAEITKAGLIPIIRVIARNLSENDALLVEKTLLWKLGRQLTNKSSGHYSENFRPYNSLHKIINGFDYECDLYYYNVGEGDNRNWDDYKKYGFISAGQGVSWRDAMLGFNEGDVIAAYLKGKGYVGIGKLTSRAMPIREVLIKGRHLLSYEMKCKGMQSNVNSDDLCEYVATVDWIKAVERKDAVWRAKSGIYTTQHVRASLANQQNTVDFLEQEFGIRFDEYLI